LNRAILVWSLLGSQGLNRSDFPSIFLGGSKLPVLVRRNSLTKVCWFACFETTCGCGQKLTRWTNVSLAQSCCPMKQKC
jgi:hypothetical protein